MKKKLLPLILLVAVVAGASIYHLTGKDEGGADGNLKISGNIEAHESVVGFKVQGRLAELPVEEGQTVRAGDVIAGLDRTDYQQQVHIDEATVGTREAELALALSGSRTQERKAAEQAVVDARAALELSRVDAARYQSLYEKDQVSAQLRDTHAANLTRAEAAYERARQQADMVREGVRSEQIAIHRAGLHAARQALQLSRIRLGETTLRAPISGVALVRHGEIGEIMAPGAPVVTIADLDRLWLRGYIGETDLGRVKLGQAVTVRSDTFPQKAYRGRVAFISAKAEFTPKSVETHKERVTLVYRVKIDLDNPTHELKPGMPADAYIETRGAP